MDKFFYLDTSPLYKDKYVIRLNHEKFLFPHGTQGSYGVFVARVANLSYASYLRYCRDRLHAELIGKNCRYIIPLFDNTPLVNEFIKLLNRRMELVKQEQDYPFDYVEEDGKVARIPFNNSNENNS